MNTTEKLSALVDTILVNPFTKTQDVDEDGNIKYLYAVNPFGQGLIPCADTVVGKVWYLFDFLATTLVNNLVIWKSNTMYRKYQLVRYGLDDYMSLEQTSSIPTEGNWVKIRTNIQGPAGEDGDNVVVTL
jgi:hypothetical protein